MTTFVSEIYNIDDNMEENKYVYKYLHPAVTTDCVVFGFDDVKLKVLLVERKSDPYKGKWAFPGGFVNIDESCEAGALRELQEETGLTSVYIEQFYTFSEPNRDPRERVITVGYYALVRIQDVKAGDDAAKAEWFALDELPELAFDHDMIFQMALKRLRERVKIEPIGFELLPEKFTMKQLQSLYEQILGVRFDSENFEQKMRSLNILKQLDESVCITQNGVEYMYSLNEESYRERKRNVFCF